MLSVPELTPDGDIKLNFGNRLHVTLSPLGFAAAGVRIGRHCLLGHHLRITDRNEYGLEHREIAPPAEPILIEDHVWIGAHVIILPGVRIGRNSAIGAGSVVTKDVPADCVAAGNPARVLRQMIATGAPP